METKKRIDRPLILVGVRTLLAKTCVTCWQLKSRYHRRPDGYWQTQCWECQHISGKKADKTTNHKSWDKAHKAKQPWTTGDVKVMNEMTEQGYSQPEIAAKLGRSVQAIRVARNRYKETA